MYVLHTVDQRTFLLQSGNAPACLSERMVMIPSPPSWAIFSAIMLTVNALLSSFATNGSPKSEDRFYARMTALVLSLVGGMLVTWLLLNVYISRNGRYYKLGHIGYIVFGELLIIIVTMAISNKTIGKFSNHHPLLEYTCKAIACGYLLAGMCYQMATVAPNADSRSNALHFGAIVCTITSILLITAPVVLITRWNNFRGRNARNQADTVPMSVPSKFTKE